MDPIKNSGSLKIVQDSSSKEKEPVTEIFLSSRPTRSVVTRSLRDLGYCAASVASSKVVGAVSYVASFLYGKSAPPALDPETFERQKSYIKAGREMASLIGPHFQDNIQRAERKDLLFPKKRTIPESEWKTTVADINDSILNTTIAFFNVAERHEVKVEETFINSLKEYLTGVFNTLEKSPEDAGRQLKDLIKEYRKILSDKLGSKLASELIKETHLIRGCNTPKVLETHYEIGGIPLKETAEVINTYPGAEFLYLVGFKEDADNLIRNQGIRTSESKNDPDIGGKTVNGWVQSLDSGKNNITAVFRSGIFSVHSFKTLSLEQLKDPNITENPKKMQKLLKGVQDELELPDGLAISEKGMIVDTYGMEIKDQEAAVEIINKAREITSDKRLKLGIAQGLPKIIASLKRSSHSPQAVENALKTGSFLHVEMSLVSELGKEMSMMEDMITVMDHLHHHLKVRFSDESALMALDGDEILITLPLTDSIPVEAKDRIFGISSIFFNEGVNGGQSAVNIISDSKLQYDNNDHSLNQLYQYAEEAGLTEETSEQLRIFLDHYRKMGDRKVKDLKGYDMIIDLVGQLGGQVGIVCKSGKDRTGMEVSRIFTRKLDQNKKIAEKMALEMEPNLGYWSKFWKSPRKQALQTIKDRFDRSLSYVITGYNTGIEKGYAFSEAAYTTMPYKLFAPEWELCRAGAAT